MRQKASPVLKTSLSISAQSQIGHADSGVESAAGVASFWGRLFSIMSPLIAASLLVDSLNAPLYLAGGGVFISTIALLLMPYRSLGAQSY
jgi:hypothetical protein